METTKRHNCLARRQLRPCLGDELGRGQFGGTGVVREVQVAGKKIPVVGTMAQTVGHVENVLKYKKNYVILRLVN